MSQARPIASKATLRVVAACWLASSKRTFPTAWLSVVSAMRGRSMALKWAE
jgi:hypothetical protein